MSPALRVRQRAPRRLLPLVLALLAGLWAAPAPAGAAQADTARAGVRLTVSGLSGVLGPGAVTEQAVEDAPEDLRLRLLVENDGEVALTDLRVVVEVYTRVEARSVLRQALDAGEISRRLRSVTDVSVRDGGPVAPGEIAGVEMSIPGSKIGWSRQSGVYPVQVTVLHGSESLDEAMTAVVYLADPPAGTLSTVVVWPLDTRPWRGPDGVYPAGVDGEIRPGGRIERLLAAAEQHRGAAVHLAPAAHLLEDLQDRADGFRESVPTTDGTEIRTVTPEEPAAQRARQVLERIRALVRESPLAPVAGPYADADVAAMVAGPAPLPEQAVTTLTEGRRRLQRLTDRAPDPSTYLATTPLSRATLDVVPGDHLLLPWEMVSGPDLSRNPDLPFALRRVTASSGRPFTAAVADPRVTELLTDPDVEHGLVLATQRVVAETGMVFFEAPYTAGRPLLILPPPDWDPDPRFPASLLGTLGSAAWIELTSATAQLSRAEGPLPTLQFATSERPALPTGVRSELASAHRQLAAIRQALPEGETTVGDRSHRSLMNQLLRAPSLWFHGGEVGRSAALVRDVAAAVDLAFGTVEVPSSANITLPSDTGSIPVTLRRPTGSPLHVCVEVTSPGRLVWPDGEQTCVLLAGNGSQTVSFRTRALTRGRSPVTVRVTDPNTVRELGRATLTVNSTSISRPALLVTGAVVVLLLLWGATRRRRASRPRLEVVE